MTVFIYAILIFLVIRFSVTVFNFLSNPRLPRAIKHYKDKVSILIPARDEAENILQLLQSIKEQDYSNYEVIVLDDGVRMLHLISLTISLKKILSLKWYGEPNYKRIG